MGNELREIVRQIKDQTDIVEVIGRTVPLKKAGASYKGKCPFHNEKTPSFNVLPARGMFHCFGCGAGGSVIDFVMRSEHLEFIEAVNRLAKELGLEMPQARFGGREERDEEQRLRHSVQTANEAALAFFRDMLKRKANPRANEYLPERGITPELVERFQIGSALDEWDALKNALMRRGFSESLLVEAGLCVRSERGSVYDRFRDRLIFPIFDVNGRICGFGGRQLTKDDKSPKYLNSAETILYKKSHILYALNLAKDRVHETGYAILCEGYMDVVMAHAYGFDQAVASLGTALTREQARLLKRFANKTYFLYDGDSAGQKAMLRGGEPLLESGFDVRVLPLPAEDDPDTFLRREGADALKAKLNEADEFFDFALKSHSQTLDLQSLAGQAELVERLSPILVAMRNDVMREGAILRLLKRLGGLPREAINQILDRKKKDAARRSGESREGLPEEAAQTPEIRGAPPLDSLERNLLKVMLESSDALNMIRMHLHFDWIADDRLADWIFFLNDHHEYVQTLLDDVEVSGDYPGDQRILTSIMAWDHPLGDPVETAGELLRRLHERHQLSLTRQLLNMIDEKQVQGEAADRLLMALHHENRTRIEQAGKYLRTKDHSRSRL